MKRQLWCLALLLLPGIVQGDGVMVPPPDVQNDIQEPTQKALIVWNSDGVEDLMVQVKYSGAPAQFAWLVPTPSRPTIGTCPNALFRRLSSTTIPGRAAGFGGGGFGGGNGGSGVQVVENVQVGYYDATVLRATNADELLQWLRSHGFAAPTRLSYVVGLYLQRHWYFTAMRIDLQRAAGADPVRLRQLLKDGDLQPLRLTFGAGDPIYPLRISSLNGGISELLIYLCTPTPVLTPGFKVEYRYKLPGYVLNNATDDSPHIAADVVLTKIVKRMRTISMTEDLIFKPDPNGMSPVLRQ